MPLDDNENATRWESDSELQSYIWYRYPIFGHARL